MQKPGFLLYSKAIPTESYITFAATLVALFTISMVWEYRKSIEVRYFILVEVQAAFWAMASGFELMAQTLEHKILWAKLSYFGIAFLPFCYFIFTTAFSQKNKIITTRSLIFLSLVPLITIPLVLTNKMHHMVWKDVIVSDSYPATLIIDYNFWFWIFWAYSFSLIIAGLYNLLLSAYEFTDHYKSQVRTLFIATFIPVLGNIMYITGFNPVPGFDWTPVLFIFTGLLISYGVVRYSMFNLVPYARNSLIDTMSDGFLIVNADGYIEDNNPAIEHIFGFTKPVKGKRFTSVFAQYSNLVAAVSKAENLFIEIKADHDEDVKTYHVKLKPFYNRVNQFCGHLVHINNITSLKKTENRLKHVNKKLEAEVEERGQLIEDLDAFAHTVAHDLKNSLGSIYNVSEIIEECIREGNIEMLKDFSGDIKDSARRSMKITQELLLLATVNHHDVAKEVVDMGQIFDKAYKRLNGLIKEYDVQVNYPDKWPEAMGYSAWIEEIWTNYLTNAIKYGGNPPVISVGADAGKHFTRFWISDNGDGIHPSDQDKLFKKYSRLNPDVAEGYGLGLSIVKKIAAKLGGNVGVESTGKKGKGACFWFELPSVKAESIGESAIASGKSEEV